MIKLNKILLKKTGQNKDRLNYSGKLRSTTGPSRQGIKVVDIPVMVGQVERAAYIHQEQWLMMRAACIQKMA